VRGSFYSRTLSVANSGGRLATQETRLHSNPGSECSCLSASGVTAISRRSLPSPDLNDGKQKYRIDERVCAHGTPGASSMLRSGIEPFLLTGEKTGGWGIVFDC